MLPCVHLCIPQSLGFVFYSSSIAVDSVCALPSAVCISLSSILFSFPSCLDLKWSLQSPDCNSFTAHFIVFHPFFSELTFLHSPFQCFSAVVLYFVLNET